MSTLEKSVQRLAGALDHLEASLDDRLGDLAARTETMEQARLKARTAKTQASVAAEELAGAIRDLKSLITAGDAAGKEG